MSPTGSFNSLADWLVWLETLSPKEIDLGLERIEAVLARLDLDLPERVIHVAGTNGKGSSVAMLEALLLADGAKTGCYTSPHIFSFNERIRVNGAAADDAEIVSAFETVEASREGMQLTYFEYATVAALVHFSRRDCDALVLEVGMGGRLDAVNAIDPLAGLITNVALDHCDWLGDDVETISREKAGIMRPGKPIVFAATDRPAGIDQTASEKGAHLIRAGHDFSCRLDSDGGWSWRGATMKIDGLRPPSLPGAFQIGNACAVLALAEAIGMNSVLNAGAINKAFSGLSLPGRFQRIRTDRDWILDVAHNPHASAVLGEALQASDRRGSLVGIIAALDDKDPEGIAGPLLGQVDRWIAVTAAAPRAIDAMQLALRIATVSNKPCLVAASIEDALQYAVSTTTEQDSILVTGSFYLVGPALEWIQAASR